MMENSQIGAIIHLEADLDCQVLHFGNLLCTVTPGVDQIIRLRKGRHKLQFVSAKNLNDTKTIIYEVENNEIEDFISIELLPIQQQRIEEEEKEKNHRLSLPDKSFHIYRDPTNLKYGFIDSLGKILIPIHYDEVRPFHDGMAMVCVDGKWGFVDRAGQVVISPIYDNANNFCDGLAKVCIIQYCNNCPYPHMAICRDSEYCEKWGVIDKTCHEIIPPLYDRVSDFCDDVVWAKKIIPFDFDDEEFGYETPDYLSEWHLFDKKGHEIIIWNKDGSAGDFSGGWAPITDNAGWCGFIDKFGREIVPCKYHGTRIFSNFCGLVRTSRCNGGYWHFVDRSGREIKCRGYYQVGNVKNGLAIVEGFDSKQGLVDEFGHEILPPTYDWISLPNDGLARVKLNEKYGYIDASGQEIIPLIYDEAWSFDDGLAVVCLKENILGSSISRWGFIDKSGKVVIPLKYFKVRMFQDGLAPVNIGQWGFVDKTGQEIIPPKYDQVISFYNGFARVSIKNRWGFIDKTGQEIIPLLYGDINDIFDKLTKKDTSYWYDGLHEYIYETDIYLDIFGQEYSRDEILYFNEGMAIVCLKEKYGFVDITGKEIVSPKYDLVLPFCEGLARVVIDGVWRFIDKTGKEITPR